MADLTIHSLDTAPDASKPSLEAAQKKYGFIPNLIGELANSPTAVEAYLTLAGIYAKSTLTPGEQQVVMLTSSFENDCHYCMAAHSGAAKMAKLDAAAIEALRAGTSIPDEKLEALRRFASLVVVNRGWVPAEEQQAFLDAGYTAENALEVIVGVAVKTISNYTNHLAETPLDERLSPMKWEKPETAAA